MKHSDLNKNNCIQTVYTIIRILFTNVEQTWLLMFNFPDWRTPDVFLKSEWYYPLLGHKIAY